MKKLSWTAFWLRLKKPSENKNVMITIFYKMRENMFLTITEILCREYISYSSNGSQRKESFIAVYMN